MPIFRSLQQNGNGRDKDTWDGIGLELLSQDDVIAMCPNCEVEICNFQNYFGLILSYRSDESVQNIETYEI